MREKLFINLVALSPLLLLRELNEHMSSPANKILCFLGSILYFNWVKSMFANVLNRKVQNSPVNLMMAKDPSLHPRVNFNLK